jgi:hypothetical protein
MRISFRFFCTTVAVLTACLFAFGQTPKKAPDAKAEVSKKERKPANKTAEAPRGVLVFIDPETHQIRQPSPEEIQNLTKETYNSNTRSATAQASSAPQVSHGPGNAVGVQLDETSMSYMVATKKPDGKVALDCLTGNKAAAAKVGAAKESRAAAPTRGGANDR